MSHRNGTKVIRLLVQDEPGYSDRASWNAMILGDLFFVAHDLYIKFPFYNIHEI